MEQFGKYQLARRIGSGGMAEVFLARTTVAQGLVKPLVIKKIHPAFARSNQFINMFVDEAKICLGLNHPNIVQVFDFGTVGKTFFLAMEHVEGLDLLRLMHACSAKGVRIPVGLCSYIVQQVAKGLDYAHRKTDEFGEPLGIVHRDVSPQNVLISWDGAVKIVDFGIARARHVHEEEGIVKGKFSYMSPEQARGEPVDRRSDVYSAAVVLFEMVCGRQLFEGKGKKVLEKVKAGAITRPRFLRPDLPKQLETIMLEALAFHPDDRLQTARDLQNSLGRFQLQLSRSEDDLFDSGSLAQFVSQVIPAEKRRISSLPPVSQPVGTPSLQSPASGSGIDTGVVATDQTAELRERKHVFVIEGKVCGFASLERRLGTGGARAMVDDFFGVARDIAYKHDAHVHVATETSFTFIVGLPVSAEDDAARSIRLALALVDALDGIGHDVEPELRLAVGIQRGTADLTRPRGGKEFTYELAESTTAMARTLAAAAHGAEVLVGGRVYRLARAEYNFEKLTSIDVPAELDTQPGSLGVEESDTEPGTTQARVYRLRGPKERAQRMRERAGRVELMGRDLELKALRDLHRDIMVNRSKHTFALIGDAGVGKRSMVTQFLDGIGPSEAVVIRAAARVSTAYTPFAIIADLARDLLGLADGAAPAEITKRLERVAALIYGEEADEREVRGIVQAMGMLLGGRGEGEDGDIDADERRQRILGAMRRVEQRLASDKALIVVGEDVHWADGESIDLFLELLELPSSRPILGIVTSRPDPRVERLIEEGNAVIVRLEELDDEAARELITRRFVPGEEVAALAAQILARTGGTPFFIREVLDSLEERGIVVAAGDDDDPTLLRWVKRDAPIQVPTSVESLLATRIDGLAERAKETIVRAAVLGRSVRPAAVSELLGRDAGAELAELVAKGFMVERSGAFAFRNDMIMTVAYGLLPNDERIRLHRHAAELIASSAGYRPGQDDAIVARHRELAGDDAEAAACYLAAANHAVDVGGNADAFRQLTRALKLLPVSDHESRFAARAAREQILARLARRPEQLREIHKLRQEAEALEDDARIALAYARQAQFYIDVGKAPAASRAVGPALEHARRAGDRLAEAEALRLRSTIARLVGNNEEALALCEQALDLCGEDRPGLMRRATILNNRGTTLWNMSRLHEAIESYAEALVIYRALELPRFEARALNNMGIVFAALGEFEESLAHYKSSLKIDQKLGDRASLALKLANIGQTYSDLGDTDRGERYLVKALGIADQMSDRSSATDAAISLGQVYLAQGRHRKALDLLERGLSLAGENRERYQEIRALIYLALAQLDAGDPPEGALELARSATELSRKMPMPVGEIFGLAAQSVALRQLDRAPEAAELSAEAVKLQEAHAQPEGAEQILHIHAGCLEACGRIDEAMQVLERAAAEVRSKADRIADPQLRAVYLGSKTPAAIAADAARLGR